MIVDGHEARLNSTQPSASPVGFLAFGYWSKKLQKSGAMKELTNS
jgi:hypothetical protein